MIHCKAQFGTDTAAMRRTLLGDLIDRYVENVLDPSSSNYVNLLGQLRWWKGEIGHCIITHLTEDPSVSLLISCLRHQVDLGGQEKLP